MDWLIQLFTAESVAHTVVIIGIVAAVGLALGSIRILGIQLGIAGVLFSGLIAGHIYGVWGHGESSSVAPGKSIAVSSTQKVESLPGAVTKPEPAKSEASPAAINKEVIEFAREFGLILFVYTIGVQVGPGFLASLRKQGLPLNIMAGSIVLLGAAITIGIHFVGGVKIPAAVGLFSGATTNTPSMAAAQEAMKDIRKSDPTKLSADDMNQPALGYAVAYPFGIIGIIITMIGVRTVFKIDPKKEGELFAKLREGEQVALATMNLEVRNINLDGVQIHLIPTIHDGGVVISRVKSGETTKVARGDTTIKLGDILLAVGPKSRLDELKLIVGAEAKVDLKSLASNIHTRKLLVTRSAALGQTISELNLGERYGVTVTRVTRADIELPPSGVRLNFGDTLTVVGENLSIKNVASEVGDSMKRLNHPQIIPIFIGIALGVLLGSFPLSIPGIPAPVKLGLAGGPLVAAIILSRIGNIGPLVWHMPSSANHVMREIGIVLFLSCVGIKAGDKFIPTLTHGDGLYWMALAALITIVPLIIVGLIGRLVYKVNYLSLCGLLAGSMTDPPALAFAGTLTGSDAPSISYATVYPLVMLLRVVSAQALVLLFVR